MFTLQVLQMWGFEPQTICPMKYAFQPAELEGRPELYHDLISDGV